MTTFKLPDLRGEFVRGWDDGRGIDSGRVMGSWQKDDFKSHNHQLRDSGALGTNMGIFHYGERGGYNDQSYNETSSSGGTETRPRNCAMLACIKY